MTPAMILECKRFEKELPPMLDNSKAYVLGHKCALEMMRKGDDSWEAELLSRMIMQHAWALAYIEYVRSHNAAAKSSAMPYGYEIWREREIWRRTHDPQT